MEVDPDNPEYYYFLGALHDMKREDEKTIRYFREYLSRGGRKYRTKVVFLLEKLGVKVEEIPKGPEGAQEEGSLPFGLGPEPALPDRLPPALPPAKER
jgi:hypothetical protein